MILVILLYMLFAISFTIGKAALAYTTPLFFLGIRMFFGGSLLLLYQIWIKGDRYFNWKDLGLLAQVSFFQYFAAFVLEFWAMQWVPSFKACFFYNISPFFTAIIGYLLLDERLTVKKIAGLCIGFIGLLPMLMAETAWQECVLSGSWLSLPEIALLGAVFSASYGWIVLKMAQERGYNTLLLNGYTMTASGIAALASSFYVEGMPALKEMQGCYEQISASWLCSLFGPAGSSIVLFALYTIILILLINVIAFNLYGYLLQRYSATFVSFVGFITPLFAAVFGWFFLGETIGWPFIVSMLIIFVGLYLFYQDEF